jgi:hypothetical protein
MLAFHMIMFTQIQQTKDDVLWWIMSLFAKQTLLAEYNLPQELALQSKTADLPKSSLKGFATH